MPDDLIKISALPELEENISSDDWLVAVDVSEPIEAQKTKKIKAERVASPLATILNAIYPVGIVIELYVSTNPATLFGIGTWTACGVGRSTVCYDATQSEFNELGKTGGAKTHTLTSSEMPSHTHTQNSHTHTIPSNGWSFGAQNANTAYEALWGSGSSNVGSATATNQNTGGGQPHNNLHPYEVVYRWRRTA